MPHSPPGWPGRRQRFLLDLAFSLAAGAAAAAPARAEINADNFSAFVTLTSDYVHRGVSQSESHLAVQGGFDFEHELGLFAGVWASNVDIPASRPGHEPRSVEVDYYLGFGRSLTVDWSADLTLLRYTYPGDDRNIEYNYNELVASVYFRDLVSFGVAWSNDVFGHGGTGVSYDLTARFPVADRIAISAGVGYYDLEHALGFSYAYWDLGLSRASGRFVFDVGYFGASGPAREFFGEAADGRLVVSVSAGLQ